HVADRCIHVTADRPSPNDPRLPTVGQPVRGATFARTILPLAVHRSSSSIRPAICHRYGPASMPEEAPPSAPPERWALPMKRVRDRHATRPQSLAHTASAIAVATRP